jgi:hypothetical protein
MLPEINSAGGWLRCGSPLEYVLRVKVDQTAELDEQRRAWRSRATPNWCVSPWVETPRPSDETQHAASHAAPVTPPRRSGTRCIVDRSALRRRRHYRLANFAKLTRTARGPNRMTPAQPIPAWEQRQLADRCAPQMRHGSGSSQPTEPKQYLACLPATGEVRLTV